MRFATLNLLFGFVALLSAQPVADPIPELQTRGEAQMAKRDWSAALQTYEEAVATATGTKSARLDFFLRRLGIVRYRLGDMSGALDVYLRAIEAGDFARDEETYEESLQGAAATLQQLGRLDEALSFANRRYELVKQCGNPAHQVRAMVLLGAIDMTMGKTRDAARIMESALKISRASGDRPGTATLAMNLAITDAGIGDRDSAIALMTESLSLTDPTDKPALAIAYNNLADMQFEDEQTAQGLRSLTKSLDYAEAPDAWRIRIVATLSMAEMHIRESNFAAAETPSMKALQLAREKEATALESAAQRVRAEMFLGMFRGAGAVDSRPEATEAVDEALRLARLAQSDDRIYKALFTRGKIMEAREDLKGGQASFDEALRIGERMRAESPGDAADLRGAFERLLPLYRASAKNLIAQHLPLAALQRSEEAKARVLMDILLRGGVDERSSMTSVELTERDQLRKRMMAANKAAGDHPSPTTIRQADDAGEALRQFLRTLYGKHAELALQSDSFEAAGPSQLAALIPDKGRALLDYFFVPSGLALFVVRLRDGEPHVSVFLLPDPGNTLEGEIRQFRQQIANRDPDYRTAARHLFDRLLGPAMTELKSATEWIVSPDGALWEVPFYALMDPAGRHVVETRALSVTPSLTAAARLRMMPRATGSSTISLLAMGNPLPAGVPLPDAALEVQRIGADVPGPHTVVLTGSAATLAYFLEQAPRARIIHLAAHGGLNDRDPLASFVQLATDEGKADESGMLTARDILDMRLQAELVVLSACETALGKTGPGEGMMGMGWALSAAGASSSILSYWKIDSSASKDFMIAFYRHLKAKQGSDSKASLLRSTALEMMRSPGRRHPFYWAAFSLWGSGF